MSRVVLDSDILIDLLRGRAPVKAFVLDATTRLVPCCSVISVAEIFAGMRPGERDSTVALLDSMLVLPVSRSIAELAGYFKGRARSRRLELADCLIAATAVVEGASLATGNVRDYPTPELTVVTPPRR